MGEIYARSGEKNDGSVGIDRNITVATMQFKDDVKVSTTEYLKTYYTFNVGDIAFEGHQSKEFRFGRFVENDIGNGIVSHIFAVFRPIVEYDLKFWKYAINNERLMQRVLSRSTKASTMMHDLVTDDFLNESFLVPTIEEQRKIGDYFSHLDHLITLHQRKLEKLKIVKKAMLENCFPKNGEKVPRFRFSGFTGDWEQRKLGEIGKARSGVGFPDAEQGGRTGVPFFKVSDMNLDVNENEMTISNNYVTAEQIANHRWSPITELPAIFFAKVGAAVLLNRKRLCRFPFLLDNNTMSYSLSPTKWDADFAKALFGTVDLTSLVQVGALPSYNAGDVESMEKYLPSLLEQEQIGVFFKRLDHLITLHQRKLEKLKIIKKSFLEKMFV